MLKKITKKAYAKINLGLDILFKREDSYHELKMLMQTIDLYDELEFSLINEDKIELSIEYFDELNKDLLIKDKGLNKENNIVFKAASLIKKEYKVPFGVSIILRKNIPIAAGLAGGSTDCATTLIALNELFKLKLSKEDLFNISLKLGLDVAYFINAGTIFASGKGENLKRLKNLREIDLILIKPKCSIATKEAYEKFDFENKIEVDIDAIVSAIEEDDINKMAQNIKNVMEAYAIKKYPFIKILKDELIKRGAISACMSGSGPSIFGIFTNKEKLFSCYKYLKDEKLKDYIEATYITKTINI